jgi:hypothetical protein
MQVIGKISKYTKSGELLSTEDRSITLDEGDRVIFIDNSYTNDIPCQDTENVYGKKGQVIRIGAVQEAIWNEAPSGKQVVEMPIVVLCDDGNVIYANPLNLTRLTNQVTSQITTT